MQFNNDDREPYNEIDINSRDQRIDITESKSTFEESSEPVTLTWKINAYVKNKTNIIKRIKERIRPVDEEPEVKHILKDGIFINLNNNFLKINI